MTCNPSSFLRFAAVTLLLSSFMVRNNALKSSSRVDVLRGLAAATAAMAVPEAFVSSESFVPEAYASDVDFAECSAVATEARAKIASVVKAAQDNDVSALRPTAKVLLQKGDLRSCLEAAARGPDANLADHAQNALEYIASVVEFDAFDKLTKDYQPKASQAYSREKIDFSLRAYGAADRELVSYIFLLKALERQF